MKQDEHPGSVNINILHSSADLLSTELNREPQDTENEQRSELPEGSAMLNMECAKQRGVLLLNY